VVFKGVLTVLSLSADFLVMCDSYYYQQPFIGMWAYSSKSSKFEIFGKNLPQGTNLLERFFLQN